MRTVTLAVLAAACATPADQLRSVLPDDRLLIDEFQADALARGVGEDSEYYLLTRQVSTDLNAGIGDVLGLVEAITQFEPTWTDEASTALWGPWLDDGVYGQLWIKQEEDQSYNWAIELRPEQSEEDAWEPVLVGHVDAGATEVASAGWFVMDLTAIDAAGAGDGELGELGCQYDLREDGASATVAFGELAEDGSLPQDGAYHYEHTEGSGGFLDLALTQDVSDPQNDTLELMVVRSRWNGEGAGRGDAFVTGGDLGVLTYTESDCWDSSKQTVYFENNFELRMEGDPAQCAFSEPEYNESR
jgi:hypothetical protein